MWPPPMFWMPNGAYIGGRFGSSNAPTRCTGCQLPSHTSTWALWKSVAYRRSPLGVEAMASPLNTAPAGVDAGPSTAVVGETVGFQPRIPPSSVENRNSALAESIP